MHAKAGREMRDDTSGAYVAGNGATARYCTYARAEGPNRGSESNRFHGHGGISARTYQVFFRRWAPV